MQYNRTLSAKLVLIVFMICQIGFSQVNYLDKHISLSVREQKLEDVLIMIGRKAGFGFSYNANAVPGDSLVSLDANNIKISRILTQLIGNDYQYKMVGNHVVILHINRQAKKAKKDRKNTYTITGYIIDSRTGQKISEATVYDLSSMNSALTDNRGYYSLELPSGPDMIGLSYCKRSYFDTVLIIEPSDNPALDVHLVPEPAVPERIPMKKLQNDSTELYKSPAVKWFVREDMIAHSLNLDIYEKRPGQLSFLPYAGTNSKVSGAIVNNVSVNILAGYSDGTRGVEMGGLVNIDGTDMCGIQIAGLGNMVGRNTTGVQLAGIFNTCKGSVKGVQIAGISNLGFDTVSGAQVAGIYNHLNGEMKGVQLAGFMNSAGNDVDGIQVAGFANITAGDVKALQLSGFYNHSCNVGGVQVSGFSNVAAGNVRFMQVAGFSNFGKNIGGLQLAGFSNIASDTVAVVQLSGAANYAKTVSGIQVAGIINIATQNNRGFQLAGLLNIADTVKGCQLAVFNYADTVTGVSFGLFSLVRKGFRCFEVSADDATTAG
ncbi:MAG: hypothetical protein KJ607_11550, partial [Bacteroidetes bacterium]|nr:hypothetical protein [Bacteroidota bacterium]